MKEITLAKASDSQVIHLEQNEFYSIEDPSISYNDDKK